MTVSRRAELDLRSWRAQLVVLALLAPLQTMLLGWMACRYSPTADETAHLAAGIRIWTLRRFDLYQVNPPLVKVAAALPVVLDAPRTDWKRFSDLPGDRPEWVLGLDYMHANVPRFRWDLVLARWACIPFSLLGLWYCFRWSSALFGPESGVLSAALWCFSPNILGNGALITPDVAAASLGLAALFHFRSWLLSARWSAALLAGVMLGLAELTKMSWLILYGLLPLLWLVVEILPRHGEFPGRPPFAVRGAQLLLILFVSLDVVNVGYLGTGTLQPLGSFRFVSESLRGSATGDGSGNRFQGTWLGSLPVPLPAAYVHGMDLQRRDFEGGWRPMYSYLRGQQRLRGWWYYYLYGLCVKTTLGVWVVAAACLLSAPWKRTTFLVYPSWVEWLLLCAAPLVLFLVVSAQTGFSRYFRYVLPCFPFGFVALGSVWCNVQSLRQRWLAGLAGAGLAAAVTASLLVFPHGLAFFNLLAGGPSQGHWHLLDSNLDWGQDLYALKDWLNQHPEAKPFHLAYSGVADPELFGIDAQAVPRSRDGTAPALRPGWYAVSANHLHGYDSATGPWTYFLQQTAVDRAGYSIFIYRLEEDQQ